MKKFYVVFEGREPGVYDDWEDARIQVENFPGARFKGYSSAEEAANAFRSSDTGDVKNELLHLMTGYVKDADSPKSFERVTDRYPEINGDAWAVDASCLGNPGKMEYRGVEVSTGKEIFRVGPFDDATNNIGEFLAIVHAMALMYQRGEQHDIYSDSVSGMAWVRTRKIKTTLKPTERNKRLFELMARAITWLNTHSFRGRVMKWQTERWGEIPADFGRK